MESLSEVEAILLAEIDVDQRDVRSQFFDTPERLGARRRHTDDQDPLLLEHAPRQVPLRHEVGLGKDARALDDVTQLSHVAVPHRFREQALGARREAHERFAEALRAGANERGRQV